jgi:hypothetical protein
MTKLRQFIIGISTAATLVIPARAFAQTAQATPPITIGQKVSITVNDGRTIKGTVSEVKPAAVEMQGINIAMTDIDRIRVRDSVWDGAGKGASLGLLLGAVAGVAAGAKWDTDNDTSSSNLFVGIGAGVASGAILGAALDALRTRTVYRRAATGTSVHVRPIVSAEGRGLGVNVRW